jgi:LEA14-like dessication related protein
VGCKSVYKMRRDVKNNSFATMKIRRVGLVITLVLLLALIFLNREQVELVKQSDFTWAKISTSGYQVSSVMHLNNPNLLSSTIKKINEKLFINGQQVGELDNEIAQGIPGRKLSSFPIAIRFSKDDVSTLYADEKIEIVMKGEIVYENLFGGGTVLINQKDSVYVTAI